MASPLRVVAQKWGDRKHWEFDALLLGTDRHGTWAGLPVGTVIARPGATVVTSQPQVVLFPAAPYVATFYAPEADPPCRVYVDIATVPEVSPGLVTSVDLDLDVIVGNHGRVWVDDEDEFADHQVRWGYPAEVVADAVASCETIVEAVTRRAPPFDGTHQPWLDLLRSSTLEG
jgi:predicted RNA-binding protein associated with RNAse of E/G family